MSQNDAAKIHAIVEKREDLGARHADSRHSNEKKRSQPGFSVFYKGLLIVFVPLLVEILIIAFLASVLLQLDKESENESRYRRCAAIGAKLIVLADQAAINVMAWFRIASPELMKAYDHEIATLKKEEEKLAAIAAKDPIAGQPARDLMNSVNSLMQLLDQIAELAKQKRILEMAAVIPQMDKEFRASKSTHLEHVGSVTLTLQKIAEQSTLRQARLREQERIILVFGLIANAVVTLVLFLFFKKTIYNRLQEVKKNTILLSEDGPLNTIGGNDEIRQLDEAFHKMDEELRQASERERSLFNNASDVICVLNGSHEFERINPACRKCWGYEESELIGKSIANMILATERESIEPALRNARKKLDAARFELVLKRKDGTQLDTLWSTFWSENEQLLYCVVHDISERKKVERIKQSYMALISSDLRTPLANIARAADRLAGPLSSGLSQKAQERVAIVKTNLGRLLMLVNDLLEMSMLESAEIKLSKQHCDLQELLRRSASDLDGLAQKRKVRFDIECKGETSCLIDPNKIMQVVVNLASNAVKFSPEGAAVKLVSESHPCFWELKVIDRGRGVPEEHKEAIFEKFKQVSSADGKRSSGTGLGLPICKDIVEKHGGTIGVESEPGKGSIFWFRIPKESENVPEISQSKSATLPADTISISQTELIKPVSVKARNATRKSGMTLLQKGFVLIGIPLLVEFIFILAILSVISQTNASRVEELRQRQIASDAYQILDTYFKMVVMVSTRATLEAWETYDECCTRLQKARADMKRLIKGDTISAKYFQQSEKFSSKLDPIIADGRKLMAERGFSNRNFDKAHVDRMQLIGITSGAARRLMVVIEEAEKREEVSPARQAALRRQQGIILCGGLAFNILLSVLLARFFGKNITTRLAALADNTIRFTRELPLNPLLPGSDEISNLDKTFHEIAEKLDEARKKERAVFDNSRDLIAVLDDSFCFVSCNPAAEMLLDTRQDAVIGRCLFEFIQEEERETISKILSSENLSFGCMVETRVNRSDGDGYLMWSLSKPVDSSNVYCVAHDISERKKLEQLKQEFLAVVSHDLRNPLGSVIGFITLIKAGAMGQPAENTVSSLDEIIEEADKLLELINDLLDLEKFEAQSMQLEISKESASEISDLAFRAASAKFPSLRLLFQNGPSDLDLRCDRERLVQAFTNIYTYILRRLPSTENSAVPLSVSMSEDGAHSVLTFSDPGPNYSLEEAENLFERFRLSGNDGNNVVKSAAGLTLPLAKRIVEAHGGSLLFKNDGGERACFVVTMPKKGRKHD